MIPILKNKVRLLLKNSPAGLNGSSSKQNQIKKVNLKQKKRRKERTKERNDKWSIDELIMMMTILKKKKKYEEERRVSSISQTNRNHYLTFLSQRRAISAIITAVHIK